MPLISTECCNLSTSNGNNRFIQLSLNIISFESLAALQRPHPFTEGHCHLASVRLPQQDEFDHLIHPVMLSTRDSGASCLY